jgi:hypothetical protein
MLLIEKADVPLLCASAKLLLDNANAIASVIVETFILVSSRSLSTDSKSLRDDSNRTDYLRSATRNESRGFENSVTTTLENATRLHHAVLSNSSRPISMRRISLVPAPISYSLASRSRRPVG